eukprot:11850763-Alexandrium_andersonii.AAC.1
MELEVDVQGDRQGAVACDLLAEHMQDSDEDTTPNKQQATPPPPKPKAKAKQQRKIRKCTWH